MSALFTLAVLVLLLSAAWRDIATRTIPDTISILLLIIGAAARILLGPAEFAMSLASALMLFLLLMIAFSRELIGGGDVKIMTAFAVGLSPIDSVRFVIATTIAGGLLGVVYILLSLTRKVTRLRGGIPFLTRVIVVEAWRVRRRAPLPYGVAIAAGGVFVTLHRGSF